MKQEDLKKTDLTEEILNKDWIKERFNLDEERLKKRRYLHGPELDFGGLKLDDITQYLKEKMSEFLEAHPDIVRSEVFVSATSTYDSEFEEVAPEYYRYNLCVEGPDLETDDEVALRLFHYAVNIQEEQMQYKVLASQYRDMK